MLWVVKKNVSMRRFFWAPKKYILIDGQENNDEFKGDSNLISMWVWHTSPY